MGAEERRLLPVLVLSVFLVCSAYGQDPAAGPPTEQSGEAASLTNADARPTASPAEPSEQEPIVNTSVPSDPEDAGADFMRRVNEELDRGQGQAGETDTTPPFARDGFAGPFVAMIKGIIALCVVLALIFVLYYAVRRWGKRVPLIAGASLGKVLGRLYLDRGTALHFIQIADRILVVGVNSNNVSLVAEFNADTFERMGSSSTEDPDAAFNADSFLAQLKTGSREYTPPTGSHTVPVEDDEIASLRGDIQRLQRYLREESREPRD